MINSNRTRIATIVLFIGVFILLIALAINNLTPQKTINSITPVSFTQNNELYGFGSNFAGQLGQQNLLKSPLSIQATGLTNIVEFDAGNKHTVAITADKRVIQLGLNGIDGESNQRFVEIESGVDLKNAIDVKAGSDYSLALLEDGTVWAWGKNLAGQLGQGNNDQSTYAKKIQSLNNITQISAGYKFALALDKFGDVWAWGGSCSEARKKAAADWLNTPTTIPGIGGYYDPTSLGGNDNLNNQSEDYNSYCAIEEVIGFSTKIPIKIEGLNSIVKVSAGWGHTLALDSTGQVWGLGCNLYSQISDTPNHLKPNLINGLSNIVDISAGFRHSLALDSNGNVFAWGYNLRGGLGIGKSGANEVTPVKNSLKDVKFIEAGHDFSAILDNRKKLSIFGENNSGVVTTDLNIISTPQPIQIYKDKIFDNFSLGKTFVLVSVNK
jgi:alpha-tubulin suppressor-like RCC1 family protein